MLKPPGGVVPQLCIVSFQRKLPPDDLQQLRNDAQLVGKRGIQQKIRRALETLDIPGLSVQHSVPHGEGLGRAAAPGGSIPQHTAAQADILGVDHPAPFLAIFLPQASVDTVDLLCRDQAGKRRVKGMDALHDADASIRSTGSVSAERASCTKS